MIVAPEPENEHERLAALLELRILDTAPEEAFDRITRLASVIVGAPVVLVSLVDGERQWFKSAHGLDATETPRSMAFCAHAILNDEVMVVPNARDDARFFDNPLVTGAPNVCFYAGAPLSVGDGVRLGTLCAIDTKPREFDETQAEALRDLAAIVVDELRLRMIVRKQFETNTELRLAKQAQEQFAHMASHDLSSPLKTIINMAEIGMRSSDESRETALRHIRDSAASLESLVAGYRRLSKLECAAKETRNVADLVNAAREQLAEPIETVIESDSALTCDPVLMKQIFVNLMRNAAKYGTSNRVHFNAVHESGWTTIRAANDIDRGFPVDASIFSPFRRASNSTDGTGLGLAIVDRVVQLHGGSVSATCDENSFVVEFRIPDAS